MTAAGRIGKYEVPFLLFFARKGTNLSGAMRQQGLWDGTYPGDQDG